MNKKLTMFKLLTIVAGVFLLTLCSVACESGFADVARSSYVIDAYYDDTENILTANMTFTYRNATDAQKNRLYFHLYPRAYEEDASFSATKAISEYGKLAIHSVTSEKTIEYEIEGQDKDILAVIPAEAVEPGESLVVRIEYSLKLPRANHRLGVCKTGVNLGNWYPIFCANEDTSPYYAFGDPFLSECSDYEVSVSVPDCFTAAMTGAESEKIENGRKTITAKEENVRDFAIVLGKFNKISAKSGKTVVNYFYVDDENAKESLSCAVDAIATFSRLFGEYPYSSYDVVKTDFTSGGMEYPCLSYVCTELNRSLFSEAIIHETAHQWWYAAVGNDQINHAWMDEGLAEYSVTLFYENNPSYGVTKEKRMSDAASAYMLFSELSLDKSHAMERRLPDFLTESDYVYSSYVKGALMFDSLRNLIGDKSFYSALGTYFSEYSGKTAEPDHMIAAFEKASGIPLSSYFNGWLSGSDVTCG